jgi:hypothetical protein
LPGGIPGGGSVGVPGVAGGISGGSIGIYIVTLRFSPRSGSSSALSYHRKPTRDGRDRSWLRYSPGAGVPSLRFRSGTGFKVKNRQHPAYRRVADQF